MFSRFEKVWKDPVWSKVISVAIVWVITLLWGKVSDVDYADLINRKISIWVVLLCASGFWLAYGLYTRYVLTKRTVEQTKQEAQPQYDDSLLTLDRAFFDKIRKDYLPQDGSIHFIRQNNFAGFSFDPRELDDLSRIEYESDRPDFEFIHPQMEKIKVELVDNIRRFKGLIAVNTFGTHNGLQSMQRELEVEDPTRFWKIVDAIHAAAEGVCSKYDELIKVGRRILKV